MRKLFVFITSLLIWIECSATVVYFDGKKLIVNDRAFDVKGVHYGSTPVGQGWSYDWSQDPDLYNIDFPLLKEMGCNVIRIYKAPSTTAALDAAYENGLYVVMGYGPSWGLDYTNESVRSNIKENFLNMVTQWKDHPAVLLWVLGNENNRPNGAYISDANATAWYSLVNECAQSVREIEGANYHPVTTAISEVDDIGDASRGADDDSLPYLDFWSVQIYRGDSFYTMFSEYEASTNKPMLISEYGIDSWDTVANKENQQAQADAHVKFWREIEDNLVSQNSARSCVGGIIHMFADDWSRNQGGTPDSTHDTTGNFHVNNLYDSEGSNLNWQDEWAGIISISAGTYQKTPKRAYYEIQSLWFEPVDPNMPVFATQLKNYPNPFNPGTTSTRIECSLNYASNVTLEIYDIAGNFLIKNEDFNTKEFRYYWDGKDDSGHRVAPGVYIARMTVKTGTKTEYVERKIVVVK